MHWLRTLGTCLITAGLITASFMPARAEEEGNPDFDRFCDSEYVHMMESDYMTMHYSIKDYRALSINKPETTIGDASWESFADAVNDGEASREKLNSFSYSSLSREQQRVYDLYQSYLKDMIDLNSNPWLAAYFNPADGIQENLLTNFTEFQFREKEDFDDYLSVMSTVPQYIDDALDVTKKQAAEGFFLRDDMLDMVEESIDGFTAKKEDNELIVTFNNKIDAFAGLSEDEKQMYRDRNREIVLNSFIPAYLRMKKELEGLRGSRSFDGGMADYPAGGREYYEMIVRAKTSSDESIEEQFQECSDYLEELIDEYIQLYIRNPNVDEMRLSENTSLKDPGESLEYLRNHLQNFPDAADVEYEYDWLDPSVANDSVVAYYVSPPVDDFRHNVIRINRDGIGDENDLYSTLSHEGFPGHLYQTTWYYNTSPRLLESEMGFIGYSEGWGMYSEWCAWEVSDIHPDAAELNRIFIALSYIEDAAVDLAVNGMGWGEDEVGDWLESIGLNRESTPDLVDFVIQRPGVILPYGVGMMRFLTLRKQTEDALKESFNAKEFHTVLLTGGDRPFDMVEEDVSAYIAAKRNGTAGTFVPGPEHVTESEPVSSLPGWISLGFCSVVAAVSAFSLHNRLRRGPLA